MRTVLLIGIVLAALGALAWPAVAVVDSTLGTEAILLNARFDELTVEINREEFQPEGLTDAQRRAAVASIYGATASKGETVRYLLLDEAHVIRPEEDPELVLVVREDGYYPVDAKSPGYLSGWVSGGAIAVLAVLLLLRRRTAPPESVGRYSK